MGIIEYLAKARRVKRPGSRGGQYWIDRQGNVRYDEQVPVDLFSTKPKPKEEKGEWRRSWERRMEGERTRSTRPTYEPDDFLVRFGMRRVDYARWMGKAALQFHFQRAGEAFDDLAYAIDIPREMVGFNGRLTLKFNTSLIDGNEAGACYHPGAFWLEITKEKGIGSLAHEWGHALDNILAYETGAKAKPSPDRWDYDDPHCSAGDIGPEAPREVKQAWADLMTAIKGTPDNPTKFYKACLELRQTIHRGKYYGNPAELFARCFEAYVYDKLQERGVKSRYLVWDVSHNMSNPYWYPGGEERTKINAAMAKLIDVLKRTGTLEKALREG